MQSREIRRIASTTRIVNAVDSEISLLSAAGVLQSVPGTPSTVPDERRGRD